MRLVISISTSLNSHCGRAGCAFNGISMCMHMESLAWASINRRRPQGTRCAFASRCSCIGDQYETELRDYSRNSRMSKPCLIGMLRARCPARGGGGADGNLADARTCGSRLLRYHGSSETQPERLYLMETVLHFIDGDHECTGRIPKFDVTKIGSESLTLCISQ